MIFRAHADGRFYLASRIVKCAVGRAGVIRADLKSEGDGASPLGIWPIRRVLYRADRFWPPSTRLRLDPILPDDGWCDAVGDQAYNRPVKLPYPASCEQLWRDDAVYDLVVVLGHNDDPPRHGAGSAIFLHLARPNFEPTQGCIALARPDLLELLSLAGPDSALEIAL